MSKIRKGSIVWDTVHKQKTKVLNSVYKGELDDHSAILTGNKFHKAVKNKKVCFCEDPNGRRRFNNVPCYIIFEHHLVPYSEYLETKNLLQIKNN